jgi:glycosyltransferase involved in cell wall biosynthesis
LGNSDGHLATVAACLQSPTWLWLHEVRLPAIATTALAGDTERLGRLLDLAYPGRAPHHAAARAGWSTLALVDGGVGLTWPLVQRSRGVLLNSEVARRLLELDLPPGVTPPVHVLPPACPPVRPSARTSASDTEPLVIAFGIVAMGKRPDLLVDAVALLDRPVRLAFVGSCPTVLAEVIRDRAAARGIADQVVVTGTVDDASWGSWLDRAAVAVQLRATASGETSAAVLEALAAGLPTVTNLATAAELPPGTVRLVDGSSPAVVAEAIEEILASPPLQQELSDRAVDFARAHTAEHLAEALLEATASLRGP